jgi:hypothetical protein
MHAADFGVERMDVMNYLQIFWLIAVNIILILALFLSGSSTYDKKPLWETLKEFLWLIVFAKPSDTALS